MRAEDLLDILEKEYPNSLDGIETQHDLVKAKAQQEIIAYIRLLVTEPPKRKGK